VGDDVLTLRRPEDEVVAEKHSVARCGLTRVRATNPVCISVDYELGGGITL
jgi:hypothetical protein